MSERAVFLDRDNTLIENDGYLGDPSKVKMLPGAATALVALRGLGYRLIVVSNQSGVARGMFTEADVEAVNNEVSRQLRAKAGAYIDASYYCPYHPEAPLAEFRVDHDWRKPKPGMLLQAAADFGLDLKQSWMVGDQGRDIAAGAAAGCRTILLRDGNVQAANGAEEDFAATPDYVVKSLADAARIIASQGHTQAVPVVNVPAEEAVPVAEAEEPEEVAPVVEDKPAEAVKNEATPVPEVVVTVPEKAQVAVKPKDGAPAAETAPAERKEEKTPAGPEAAGGPAAGGTTGGAVGISGLERHLDELVVQMRLQNRNAFLRPDFSFSTMAALIVQFFAVVAVVIGLAKYFTAPATFNAAQDAQFALLANMAALFWVMAAGVMEGIVVALLLYAKHKHGE